MFFLDYSLFWCSSDISNQRNDSSAVGRHCVKAAVKAASSCLKERLTCLKELQLSMERLRVSWCSKCCFTTSSFSLSRIKERRTYTGNLLGFPLSVEKEEEKKDVTKTRVGCEPRKWVLFRVLCSLVMFSSSPLTSYSNYKYENSSTTGNTVNMMNDHQKPPQNVAP